MGSKRGKILIRQPRVKKESDSINQRSPELEQDPIVYTQTLSIPHHHKIERHASEPAPIMTPSSPHLLSVPQPSYLVKQHSHPVLPSQSTQSPPSSATYTFQRQLSHPNPMTSTIPLSGSSLVSTSLTATSGAITHLVQSSVKSEPETTGRGSISPTVVVITDPMITAHEQSLPAIRVKSEELQRSISSPHTITRELSIENRSRHCPVVRPGPALGCNYCWNTIDAFGRILRRKTKYHCPECQTNLCIVPCFQEYHERQCNESSTNDNSKNSANLRHYTKTGSM